MDDYIKSFPHAEVHSCTTTNLNSNRNLNIKLSETRAFIKIRMGHKLHFFQTRWLHLLLKGVTIYHSREGSESKSKWKDEVF